MCIYIYYIYIYTYIYFQEKTSCFIKIIHGSDLSRTQWFHSSLRNGGSFGDQIMGQESCLRRSYSSHGLGACELGKVPSIAINCHQSLVWSKNEENRMCFNVKILHMPYQIFPTAEDLGPRPCAFSPGTPPKVSLSESVQPMFYATTFQQRLLYESMSCHDVQVMSRRYGDSVPPINRSKVDLFQGTSHL